MPCPYGHRPRIIPQYPTPSCQAFLIIVLLSHVGGCRNEAYYVSTMALGQLPASLPYGLPPVVRRSMWNFTTNLTSVLPLAVLKSCEFAIPTLSNFCPWIPISRSNNLGLAHSGHFLLVGYKNSWATAISVSMASIRLV